MLVFVVQVLFPPWSFYVRSGDVCLVIGLESFFFFFFQLDHFSSAETAPFLD